MQVYNTPEARPPPKKATFPTDVAAKLERAPLSCAVDQVASEVSVIARDIVIAGNVPPVPASTVTMGLADASAVVADAMFVKAFCALVGVRNLVRVKTEAVFCG
jgi:hypothetical protein